MSANTSGKGRGITKEPDPEDDNQKMSSPSHSNEFQMRGSATEHAKHLVSDREDNVTEQQLFKLNEFLTHVIQEM